MQPRERLPNTDLLWHRRECPLPFGKGTCDPFVCFARTFLIVLHFAMKMVLNFDVLQFLSFLWTFLIMFVCNDDRCGERRRYPNSAGEWIQWKLLLIILGNYQSISIKVKIHALYYLEISSNFRPFFCSNKRFEKTFPSHRGQSQIHIYTKSDKNYFCLSYFHRIIASSLFVCEYFDINRVAQWSHSIEWAWNAFIVRFVWSSRAAYGICSMRIPRVFLSQSDKDRRRWWVAKLPFASSYV